MKSKGEKQRAERKSWKIKHKQMAALLRDSTLVWGGSAIYVQTKTAGSWPPLPTPISKVGGWHSLLRKLAEGKPLSHRTCGTRKGEPGGPKLCFEGHISPFAFAHMSCVHGQLADDTAMLQQSKAWRACVYPPEHVIKRGNTILASHLDTNARRQAPRRAGLEGWLPGGF